MQYIHALGGHLTLIEGWFLIICIYIQHSIVDWVICCNAYINHYIHVPYPMYSRYRNLSWHPLWFCCLSVSSSSPKATTSRPSLLSSSSFWGFLQIVPLSKPFFPMLVGNLHLVAAYILVLIRGKLFCWCHKFCMYVLCAEESHME